MKWNEDKKILCLECADIATIKSLTLCTACYSKKKYHERMAIHRKTIESKISLSDRTIKKIKHRAEIKFAQMNSSLIYQPATFHLPKFSYTPDFYDPLNDIFYEVVGTRQAFHQSKMKLKELNKFFPNIKLLIVNPDGTFFNGSKDSSAEKNLA